MKHHKPYSDSKTLLITLLLVTGFVLIAFISSIPLKEIASNSNMSDSAFAGTQESVDTTSAPNYEDEEDFEESALDGSGDFEEETAIPTATTRASVRTTTRPSATLALTTAIASPTSFDFFENTEAPIATPVSTIPPFDLDLPDGGGTITDPTPSPTPVPQPGGANTQGIIIGSVVGVIVLILVIVGIILLRKSRDNSQPPMMPMGGNNMPPTSPDSPQYPPYINQQ